MTGIGLKLWGQNVRLKKDNLGQSLKNIILLGSIIKITDFSLVNSDGQTAGANTLGLLIYEGGTVCDDGFTDNSADAICYTMGYPQGHTSWGIGNIWSIQSNYEITLSNAECSSGEWSSCSYLLSPNCGHSEDVFLQCGGPGKFTFVMSDLHLQKISSHSFGDYSKWSRHLVRQELRWNFGGRTLS